MKQDISRVIQASDGNIELKHGAHIETPLKKCIQEPNFDGGDTTVNY